MSTSAVNATYSGYGPSASGQVIAHATGAGPSAQDFTGFATITGDGSTTAAVVNYIDGTQQLGFNPSGIVASIDGGNDTAGAELVKCVDDAFAGGSKTFTATFAPAIASGKTVKIAFSAKK